MRTFGLTAFFVLGALLSNTFITTAQAQCTENDFGVISTIPASGAAGVPLNTFIRVEYPPCYFEVTGQDPLTSLTLTQDGVPVAGEVQLVGDYLFFVAEGNLNGGVRYDLEARDFEGGFSASFRTGTTLDSSPPVLTSALAATSTRSATEDEFRVGVSFSPVRDDGALGSIEYYLYLTRAGELDAPELRARLRNFGGTDEITMALTLSAEEVATPVCVEVRAVDGVGRSARFDPVCFDPKVGPFFNGCSIASSTASMSASLLCALFALLVLTISRSAPGRSRPR